MMTVTGKEIVFALLKGIGFASPIILFFIYYWKRFWFRRKYMKIFGQKKHHIIAHFLNKEGCISSIIQTVINQSKFYYAGECYRICKHSIFHEHHGSSIDKNKKHIRFMLGEMKHLAGELEKIEKKIISYEQKMSFKKIGMIESLTNKIEKKKQKIREIERYQFFLWFRKYQKKVTEDNLKYMQNQKKGIVRNWKLYMIQQKEYQKLKRQKTKILKQMKESKEQVENIQLLSEGSGMPHIFYIDGNPEPIQRDTLLNMVEPPKWNAETLKKKFNETFFQQLLSSHETGLKVLLLISLVLNVLTFLAVIIVFVLPKLKEAGGV